MRAPPVTAPYAVNLDLRRRPVLLVGAGRVAARKLDGLLATGATITVVAPEAGPEVEALADAGTVRWHRRPYERGEVASYRLAVTATDDPATNARVAADGEAANVFVNSADDPDNCSFILPAVIRRGDLQLSVSTNGHSPAFASWLRRRLAAEITDAHGATLALVAEVRAEVRQRLGTSEIDGWDDAIDDGLVDLVASGHLDAARHRLRRALGLSEPAIPTPDPRPHATTRSTP
ncbi:MAG: bifunctional precorrin-2 dehydrogenase/sirohydrochlorin ferrochelatase [Acidimicrobiales bacterium]